METLESLTPDVFTEKSTEVLETLSNEAYRAKIPLISNWENFNQLKDMQLVRFRGLVQNMLDPEIYLQSYQVKSDNENVSLRNGKYRDNLKLQANEEVLFDATSNVHGERRPIFMVSIPGLNDWAVNIEKEHFVADSMDVEMNNLQSNGVKRSLDENETNENIGDQMDTDSDAVRCKKLNQSGAETEEKSTTNSNLSKEYLLNSPIVDRPSNACLVKLYDDATNVSLNDVLDVVGFVSMDANLCGSNRQPNDFESFDEICAMNPPPSLIPRIHVISYRSLTHINPLLHDNRHNGEALNDQIKLDCLRDLRTALTQCLFGDEIAADYLFCHLISTVYVRGDETLGQFSLNITNFPHGKLPDYTKELYDVIESILPASHYFPITIDNLNTTEFIPTKDYETCKLNSGLLQLAPHTHLVLDETKLEPGKLESHGIEGVMHISNLIRKQQLNVNFKYYTIDYNSNIPVLIFSEGKSMFPSNCHIPIKVDEDTISLINETFVALKQFLKPKLNVIRRFLTEMRLQEFDMNPENTEMIQEDFIEMRRTFNASADDLHMMMILSRMLGIIQGKKMLDAQSWNQAKTMESERRKRVEALPKMKKSA
ncbi:mini-chromosome maintenance complex-binding protein [Contarinia nasturtii]|uniref:mini-chromosome maintenance complex-binding protein n=1 Tax=Contarinia nasturtii TaxID=265458 RepID=UPI0012D3EC3C|nr:mini-chromosome maintenance complex-binding protein [Contarinia nasturtii]